MSTLSESLILLSRSRRWRPLLALLTLALTCSCEQPHKTRIGVVPKAISLVFWQSVHAGAVAAGREEDIDVDWNGPTTETDFSRQIEIVDSMINARVDGIVVAPSEATALVGVVERAAREGIPVTIFDTGINTEEYVSFVSTNNYEAGVIGARTLAGALGGKGTVAVVRMVPGSASTTAREDGFADTLKQEFPEIEIVAEQYCMADPAKALAVAENILTAHPDLGGMFASAEPATVGPVQALKARGLVGKVKLVGFDFGDTIEQALKDGVLVAAVVQDPFNIGYTAVKTMAAKLRGETPERRIDSPVKVVTGENLSDPEVDRFVHPDLAGNLN